MFKKFWKWYERHTTLNVGIASLLFTLQLVHLYWLTTDVVIVKLTEKSLTLKVCVFIFYKFPVASYLLDN